jgi:hypothetical protein
MGAMSETRITIEPGKRSGHLRPVYEYAARVERRVAL